MRIGIIGAGQIGATLARYISKLGHTVSIANSRGPESLSAFANEIGAKAVSTNDAIRDADLIILTIPQKAVMNLPKDLFAKVPSHVPVIDTGNYYPELRDGRIEPLDNGMIESQWVEQQIGRPVIKAFNNIYAESLRTKPTPKGTSGRIALSVFGDSANAKATVLSLIDNIGFDAIDGGELALSWRQQPGMPSYCNDLTASVLKDALLKADQSRVAQARIEQEELTRRQL